MLNFVKKLVENRAKRDRLIVAHSSLLMSHGKILIALAERCESVLELHTKHSKYFAKVIDDPAERQEFLMELARAETASDAFRSHIEQFKESLKAV